VYQQQEQQQEQQEQQDAENPFLDPPFSRIKIFHLDDDKVTLHNVLAVARKFEKAERACSEKESISNIFVKKESKRGKATLSQPVQQPQSTQLSTNTKTSGAKKPCNRCSKDSTYEHRQNCPAKADTCTKSKKKGHRSIICHNGKRLNATGQVASAIALEGDRAAFKEFQEFQRARQQQQKRHQQQQQEQGDKCAQIAAEFYRWNISNPFVNAITEVVECNNVNACNPTPLLFLHLKPVGKPIFRVKVLADTGATRSLISLSTAIKHGCKIRETDVRLSAANGTNIEVAGTTSLQVVEKGQLVHTIVAIVLPNVQQTIVGWQDLKAMGIVASDWPAMRPRRQQRTQFTPSIMRSNNWVSNPNAK
jgi:hypothetical protein